MSDFSVTGVLVALGVCLHIMMILRSVSAGLQLSVIRKKHLILDGWNHRLVHLLLQKLQVAHCNSISIDVFH